MKRIVKSFALLAVAASALASCKGELTTPEEKPQTGKFEYTFTLGAPETKAVLASDSEGYFAKWEAGDRLGIYTLSDAGITNNTAANIDIEKDPVEFNVVTSYALEKDSEVYAYFPYDANNSTVDPSAVVLSIPASQTGSLNAMPMAAKPYAVTEPISVGTKPIADIKMRNLGSILNFNVFSSVEAYRSETVSSIAFTTETPLCGSFTYDIMAAELADITGYEGTTVTVTKNITPGNDKNSGNTVPMVVAPNATAGYTGTIVVTTNVATYTYTISSPIKIDRSIIKKVNVDLGSGNAKRVVPKTAKFSVNGVIVDAMTQKLVPGQSVEFVAPEESLIPGGLDFMGWYNFGYNDQDNAPEYITEAVMGDSDLLYYAVFAAKTPGSAASIDFDLTSISNLGTSNAERTQTSSDITFTFSSVADANVSGTHYVQMSKGSTLTHDTAFAGSIKSITFEGFSYSGTSNASMLVEGKKGTSSDFATVMSCGSSYTGSEISFGSNDYDFFKISVGSDRTVRFTKMTVSYGTEEYYSGFCTSVKQVASIKVASNPNKVIYEEDDVLDITGLTLNVTYSDESSEVINSGFTTTPSNGAVLAQENKVQVSYRGQTCEVDITVNQKQRYDIVASATEGGSYTVKIGDADVETVPAEGKTYHARAERTITMTTKAAEHYKLASTPFTVKDADNADVSVSKDGDNYSFTMPAKAVTITANYSRTYSVTAGSCTNGRIDRFEDKDKKEIVETSYRSKVVVIATPSDHYHITSMYYVKEGEESHNVISESAGVYSFIMPQSDVTVYATFEEDTKYTATFMVNGTEVRSDGYYEGQSISFPDDPSDINGKKFQGWVTSSIDEPTDEKPSFVSKTGQTVGTEDVTYYAVFANVVEGTTSYKLVSSLTNGKNYIFVTRNTAGSGYALSSNVTTGTSVTIAESGADKVVSGTPAKTIIWTAATGWSLTNTGVDSNNKLLINGSSISMTATGSSNLSWTTSYGLNGQSNSGSTKYYVQCANNGTFSRSQSGSNTNRVYAYEEDSTGGTSGYCTTVEIPAQVVGIAISGNVTKTTYNAGEQLSVAGLTVTGTLDDATQRDLTNDPGLSWTFDPETLSAETTTCTATARYQTLTDTYEATGLTVNTAVTLVSVAVSGEPTKKEYKAGDKFEPAGLTVTGRYSDNHQETITKGITWSEPAALTAGQTSVSITATVSGVTSAVYNVTGLTVKSSGPTDFSATYTSNVTLSGSNKVIIGGNEYACANVGTSKKSGSTTFKVPTGTKYLTLHVVGWNGEDAKTHTITTSVGSITPGSLKTKTDSGAANNSPFTLSKTDYSGSDYYFVFSLTGVTSEATITISNSAVKSRGIYFGVNAE